MEMNNKETRRVVIGITAHVDAGKTTLAEAMLYRTGQLRKLGRVDHGSAAMDSHLLERERGITIFLSQAELPLGDMEVTLLDTPGHVDFSAEMERTLSVLDYAILVISGVDGVQAHTRTLWRLLELYRVPTFLFVTKMDFGRRDRDGLMESLRHELGEGCVDFTPAARDRRMEQLATCREDALEAYLDTGMVPEELVRQLVRQRLVFPCWFGSGLKLEGIDEFLEGLARYVEPPAYPAAFSARVFKISHDAQGKRLTHLKVTGGTLRAKMQLPCGKADQLRLYSGAKFRPLDAAGAGEVVAVTGLADTYPGQGLGAEADGEKPVLQSVLTYRILLPDGTDAHTVLPKLRELEDEDPMLRIVWEEASGELHAERTGAGTFRLRAVGACMISAVAPPDLPRALDAVSREPRREHPQKCRDTTRNVVCGIVKLCGHAPEVYVLFIFVAEHAVHRVDGLVGQRQRCPAKEHIQKRCNDAVAGVLGHGLHGGSGHARGGQVLRVTAHDAGHGPAGRGQVALCQFLVHIAALLCKTLGSQRLAAPEHLQRQPQRRMEPCRGPAGKPGNGQRAQRQHRGHRGPAGQLAPRRFGQCGAQVLFQRRDAPAHEHHRMRQPRRVAKQSVQQKAAQHRPKNQHVLSFVYCTVLTKRSSCRAAQSRASST